MSKNIIAKRKWSLNSVTLLDAYTDFILSRQAMQCTLSTLKFYAYTLGTFLLWTESQGIAAPNEITGRHVRAYLAGLKGQDTTIHDHARAIRTLLRFWHTEGYMPQLVEFDMPKLLKKRLLVLSVEQLKEILKVCSVRDRALVLMLVDSGLRRAEVCALNWDDLDFANGLIRVQRGKGGKARSVVIGAIARRALLVYRRLSRTIAIELGYPFPMFISQKKGRLTPWGLGLIFHRLSKRSGIHITAHALRRTFAILSLRAGMDSLHLQALGGWSDLTMVSYYAQMEDVDLLEAHSKHSPVDGLGI